MEANKTQVAGTHYRSAYQHWDFVVDADLDYFGGQITKYVSRWRNKNGAEDLKKAAHFARKLHELLSDGAYTPPPRRRRLSLRLAAAVTFAKENDLSEFELDIMLALAGDCGPELLREVADAIEREAATHPTRNYVAQ